MGNGALITRRIFLRSERAVLASIKFQKSHYCTTVLFLPRDICTKEKRAAAQSSKLRSLNPLQNLNITVRALKLATERANHWKEKKKKKREKREKRMDTDFIGGMPYIRKKNSLWK